MSRPAAQNGLDRKTAGDCQISPHPRAGEPDRQDAASLEIVRAVAFCPLPVDCQRHVGARDANSAMLRFDTVRPARQCELNHGLVRRVAHECVGDPHRQGIDRARRRYAVALETIAAEILHRRLDARIDDRQMISHRHSPPWRRDLPPRPRR